ncbi:MAG: hypothetical protein O7D34_05190 [Ignavibacteria bacterium]|nr:hypothetical protein [Ignavibacteria bacterium]
MAVEGIVPKSWNWSVSETITTPPLSIIRYSSGVTITVEPNKLQVTDSNVENGPGNSKVAEIASAYVRVLPHVRYTASGNNFQSLIQRDSPDEYLKGRFLKDGPWHDSLNAVGIRLIYPLDTGRLTLAIDTGEAKLPDKADQQAVIIANANFSRNCGNHPDHEQVAEFLGKAMEDWSHYEELLTNIME